MITSNPDPILPTDPSFLDQGRTFLEQHTGFSSIDECVPYPFQINDFYLGMIVVALLWFTWSVTMWRRRSKKKKAAAAKEAKVAAANAAIGGGH